MTNNKHTPGPWKYSFESIDLAWAIVTDSNGNIIANVNSETGPDLPPLVSTKMPQIANARLIAAAPVLLKALQIASNYMADDLDEGDETEMRVFNAIRAALAEAEGRVV